MSAFGEEERIDSTDGRPYNRQSFIETYGHDEGMRRWAASRRHNDRPGGLGALCHFPTCGKYAEVYCLDCDKFFCSHVCVVHQHRKVPGHTRVTYTLAGARPVLENASLGNPSSPGRYEDHSTSLNQLIQRKQQAVAVEDYVEAQRLKEMIEQYQYQVPSHHVPPASSPYQSLMPISPPVASYNPPGPYSPGGSWSM
eukprot:TRINITY_DN13818_c0_g1_i1.p2 TRINITY_DN13818_c0_g1~~TRINITY_DN13818_c0_g1_i1.p2  ORF type:complete len:208 (+),score=31.85 TRINITY_DN13818_c0_g1_i1:35-625(+)